MLAYYSIKSCKFNLMDHSKRDREEAEGRDRRTPEGK
jgi:hypothetical protein